MIAPILSSALAFLVNHAPCRSAFTFISASSAALRQMFSQSALKDRSGAGGEEVKAETIFT
jgi:hypothetical protein